MMRKLIVFSILTLIVFGGCEESADSRVFKHNAVGTPGDILVIMGDDAWGGKAGDTLKHFLEAEFELLPQSEPKFELTQMPPAALSKTTKRSRNLLIAKISKDYKETGIAAEYDKWAKPQLVLTAKANTEEELIELLGHNGKAITAYFEKATLDRQAAAFKQAPNKKVMARLREKFGIEMVVPKHFYIDKDIDNFLWIRNETPRLSQVVLIWTYPYTDRSQLSADKLIEIRDSVTMKQVPGPDPETSFMTSEKRIMPIYTTRELNGNFCAEIRGLWRVEGGFMGGPFINFSVIDETRNRIVTVDVFVYAGMQDKRNFVREVEAIANTLKFIEPDGDN